MSRGKRYSKVDLYERGNSEVLEPRNTMTYSSMSFMLTARCIFLTLVVVLCTTLLFVFNTFLLRISTLYEARFNPYFANKHERHACCLFREERWNRKKNPA